MAALEVVAPDSLKPTQRGVLAPKPQNLGRGSPRVGRGEVSVSSSLPTRPSTVTAALGGGSRSLARVRARVCEVRALSPDVPYSPRGCCARPAGPGLAPRPAQILPPGAAPLRSRGLPGVVLTLPRASTVARSETGAQGSLCRAGAFLVFVTVVFIPLPLLLECQVQEGEFCLFRSLLSLSQLPGTVMGSQKALNE